MAKFKRGHKGGPGRPPGFMSPKNSLRAALDAENFDVVKEYLNAIREIDKPDRKAEAIRYLLDFIYPKPTQKHEIAIEDLIAACEQLINGATEAAN